MDSITLFGEIIVKPKIHNKVGLEFDARHWPALCSFVEGLGRNTKVRMEIRSPEELMTRGPRSQMARFRGHCKDIAEQLSTPDQQYDGKEISEAMKRMAVDQGYPTKISLDGAEIPVSTAQATKKQGKILLDVVQEFADVHEFWLTEYNDAGEPYKSVGGRDEDEMKKWLKATGRRL